MATNLNKWIYSIQGGLILLMFLNRYTLKAFHYLIQKFVSVTKDGCPTDMGLILVAIAYTIVIRLMMG